MNSTEWNPRSKRAFDISKSKRTRRAFHYLSEEAKENVVIPQSSISSSSPPKQIQKNEHVKLKQLIKADREEKENSGRREDDDEGGRALLGQHFANENQLQLMIKQTKDNGTQGVKLRKMINRYVKALGHIVKVKREQQLGPLEKPTLCLKV